MEINIKSYLKKAKRKIIFRKYEAELFNKDFTIISNNCWGGHVYQDLELNYKSPFVGMFLYSRCYLKLLKNLEYYLRQELKFTTSSIYEEANEKRKKTYYPIAMLDDIELHMLHYKNEEEALTKWNRRKSRMNMDNMFVKMNATQKIDVETIKKFDDLPYRNKVIFTEKLYPEIESAIHIENMNTNKEMNHYMKYFDVVKWINNGKKRN